MRLPDAVELAKWRALADPAELVMRAWRFAVGWDPSERHAALEPDVPTKQACEDAIRLTGGPGAVAAAVAVIERAWDPPTDPHGPADPIQERRRKAGLLLALMTCADELFLTIHPRTPLLPPGRHARTPLPAWLARLQVQYTRRGWYARTSDHWLVPRGPLLRGARASTASCAESLPDRFSALGVVRRRVEQEGRSIGLAMRVVGSDAAKGVPPGRALGEERIAFVAVAETADDLVTNVRIEDGRHYLDVRPRPDLGAADRIMATLVAVDGVDLAFAPELAVSPAEVERLKAALVGAGRGRARLILAGSGLSEARRDDGLPWNEARLLNGAGSDLLRHRKVWPFELRRSDAENMGIVSRGVGTANLMEDVAAGDQFHVLDVTSFGRVVVLICQDLKVVPGVPELVREYQPDWVLVPILDQAFRRGGWTHAKAFELSGLSEARVVVGNSLAQSRMVERAARAAAAPSHPIGMAVGPRDPARDGTGHAPDRDREYATASPAMTTTPQHAVLIWRDGSPEWRQTDLASS